MNAPPLIVSALLMMLLTPAVAGAQTVAVVDVAVVDVAAGEVTPARTVVVSEGRIRSVAPTTEAVIPEGATVLDGRGGYLIPGLWDMHVHSSNDPITREVLYPLYVANGVTGVRNMNGDCLGPCGPVQSSAAMIQARRRDVEEGRLVGPRVIAAGPIIYGAEPGRPSTVDEPRTEEHGRALARRHAERKADFIKVYDQIPREAFLGLAAEARRLGIPVVGHVPWELGVLDAVEAGLRSMEHLYGVIDSCSETEAEQRAELLKAVQAGDDQAVEGTLFRSLQRFSLEKCAALYADLAEHDVWQVPTLTAGGRTAAGIEWTDDPALQYLPRAEIEYWLTSLAGGAVNVPGGLAALPMLQYRVALISVDMFGAGVPLMVGSDAMSPGAFPGFGLHDEMSRLVQAGLTPADVLRSATLEPARFLEATDSLGTVEVGKVADLVLLDANPLIDIENARRIRAVISRGRLFDLPALDALLRSAAAAARSPASHAPPSRGVGFEPGGT